MIIIRVLVQSKICSESDLLKLLDLNQIPSGLAPDEVVQNVNLRK